jgi:hypothetical protein
VTCAGCGADLGRAERVGRRDACRTCGVDLRVCRQCRFYDVGAADGCREPQAERVVDKTRGNFCDYFAVAEQAVAAGSAGAGPTAARDALQRLFARR